MTKAHVEALPAHYGTTVEALDRYLTHLGTMLMGEVPADVRTAMFDDLVGLFEQAAMNGTPPIRAVIGADPAEFAETFLRTHTGGRWSAAERLRLADAVARAEAAGAEAV